MIQEKENPQSMTDALNTLVKTVEDRTLLKTTTYLINHIDSRLDALKINQGTSEYDYCETMGRMKELELLLKTLKELS